MRRSVVMWMLVGMAIFGLFGCGEKKGANEIASLFPTAENKIIDGTTVTEVPTEEGIAMQAIGGQVIAEFYDTAMHADYASLETFLNGKGAKIIGQIPALYMVQIGVSSDDQIVPLIAELKKLSYIEDAYPNMVVSSVRDPRPAKFTGSSWADDISAKDAWNISTGKRDVIIGIVDNGVDPNNVQFKKNSIRTLNDFNVGDAHGLGVASIAVAHGDDADVNGTGKDNMAGVCWDCSIVAYDCSVKGIDLFRRKAIAAISRGIAETINAGAKVVNVSQAVDPDYGRLVDPFYFLVAQKYFRMRMKQSVKLAYTKKVLIVFAAGNQPVVDDMLFLPGFGSPEYESYWRSNVIVVTGLQRSGATDAIYKDFATGKVVDIAAPGLGIGTAAIDGSVIEDDGTSFATPMVSGTAGLIWSANPNLSPVEVKAIITDPKNTNPTNNSTIRVLNVYRALTDSRVSGIKLNGIALAVLANNSAGEFTMGPMKFNQTGSDIAATIVSGALFSSGTYSTAGFGQLTGTAMDITFDIRSGITGKSTQVGFKGTAHRSTFETGDLFVNGSRIGQTRIDLFPVSEVPPTCVGMVNVGKIRLNPISGTTQPFTVGQSEGNPNVLAMRSSEPNIRTGAGWLNGDQIFLNFLNVGDGSNPQVTILKGVMASDCGSAKGIWETFPFGSDIPIGRGPWSLVRQ